MASATITSKGQTTVPKVIRDGLRLKPGDRVEFVLLDDGTALMVPATVLLTDLWDVLPAPKKSVSIDDMNRAIRERGGRI